jgi:Alpha-kinase family
MPEAEVLDCFGHWSYAQSSGQLLVCDLQGTMIENGFLITDPALHSMDRRFGITDLGANRL